MSFFSTLGNLVCSLAGAAFNAGQDAPPARDEAKETLLKNIYRCAKRGLSYQEFRDAFIDGETIVAVSDDYVFACKAIKSYPEMAYIFSDSIVRLLLSSGALDATTSVTETTNPLLTAPRSVSTESTPSVVALAAPPTTPSEDHGTEAPVRSSSPTNRTSPIPALPVPLSGRSSPFESLEEESVIDLEVSDDEASINFDLFSETEATMPKACETAEALPAPALPSPLTSLSCPPLPFDPALIKRTLTTDMAPACGGAGAPRDELVAPPVGIPLGRPPRPFVATPARKEAPRPKALVSEKTGSTASRPSVVSSDRLLKELFDELDKEAKEFNGYGKTLCNISYLCKKAMLMALEEHLSKAFKKEERPFVQKALSEVLPTLKSKILKALESDDMDEMRMWATDLAKKIRPNVARLAALQQEKLKAAIGELDEALKKHFDKDEIKTTFNFLNSKEELRGSIRTLHMLCLYGEPSKRKARIDQLIEAIAPRVIEVTFKQTLRSHFSPGHQEAVIKIIKSSDDILALIRAYATSDNLETRRALKARILAQIELKLYPKTAVFTMRLAKEADKKIQALFESLAVADDDDDDL